MNLARALLSLPDEIEVTPWYDIRSEKKKAGTPRTISKQTERKPRKQRPWGLPEAIIQECAQLAIVQCAHGVKQPWLLVVDKVWIKYRIIVSNHSIACTTRRWMVVVEGRQ